MNSIKHLEYHQCRICYDATSNLQLLTSIVESNSGQTDEKTYDKLLLEVCNINIMEDKPIEYWPAFICFNCSHKLKFAYDFIQRTHKINQLLQSIAGLLEIKNKTYFIENPELDIPLEIKIENNEVLDVLPNEGVFQYSPIESEIIKTELMATYEDISSNDFKEYKKTEIIHDKNSKEIIIPSAIEFISNNQITFDDFDNLPKDNMEITNPNSNTNLTCSKCNKLFTNICRLNRHRRFTHVPEEKKISCPICVLKFSRTDHLKRHLKNVHKQKNSQTINTTKKSRISNTITTSACTRNSKAGKDVATLTCSVCKKIFSSRKTLSRHKRFVHIPEKEKLTCSFCHEKFQRMDQYKRHMKYLHATDVLSQKNLVKVNGVRFFCDKCDCSYTRRYRLYQHERKVHG